MRFTKMQGIGNDYIYIDAFNQPIEQPEMLAVKIADRHFGVGGDGLILVAPPTTAGKAAGAHVRMRMFNADGGEAEMCGNGIRCVAKYAFDHGITQANPMKIETGRGVLTLDLHLENGKVAQVRVNMGKPILALPEIPVDAQRVTRLPREHEFGIPHAPAGVAIPASFVSMGNPHAVIYTPDVAKIELEHIGPMLEHHPAFPKRINVHFVQVQSPAEVTMRTWERGSGITMACGTGAAAVCVAGVLTDRTNRKILAHLPGGDLTLEWREDNDCVYMTGPAVEVFSGDWNP